MATKKKSTAKTRTYRNTKSGIHNKDYVILRTYLDSLELGTLRYVLSAPTADGKHRRAEEVEELIKPILDFVWGRGAEMDCPEGYVDCNGVCISYPCVNMWLRA